MAERVKSYRGISRRLAVNYLENLGGERREHGSERSTVAGEDWTATLTDETVSVGRSLTLTEVTVVFEGPVETLDALVEQFSQKAMRAGG